MKERNVLVTTIYALDTEKTLQYCVANHAGRRRQYCSAVIPAECCVKHLLSSTPIDKIIVPGSGRFFAFPTQSIEQRKFCWYNK